MLKWIAVLALTVGALGAQTFESVSIRPAVAQTDDDETPAASGGMLYRNVSLRLLVGAAYSVRPDLISGPALLDSERYDIAAKPPAGASREQVPAMLANLLTDKFGMAAHRETRQKTVYSLIVGNTGAKMKRTAAVTGVDIAVAKDHVDITGATVPAFAGLLASYLGRAVTDRTQISGSYDFRLNVTMSELKAAADSVFKAVEDLGLVLEPRETPTEYLVVDRIEKASAGN